MQAGKATRGKIHGRCVIRGWLPRITENTACPTSKAKLSSGFADCSSKIEAPRHRFCRANWAADWGIAVGSHACGGRTCRGWFRAAARKVGEAMMRTQNREKTVANRRRLSGRGYSTTRPGNPFSPRFSVFAKKKKGDFLARRIIISLRAFPFCLTNPSPPCRAYLASKPRKNNIFFFCIL